ncbi:MAG: ribosomal-processing cysteine protease Prp [Oscillospiraceae bacterium]
MITAKFLFTKDDLIKGFSIKGHSGFAKSGNDIVCASVSSAVYMAANTITEIINLKPQISNSDALLELTLKDGEAEKAKDILDGLYLHISEMSKQYPNNIKIERGA